MSADAHSRDAGVHAGSSGLQRPNFPLDEPQSTSRKRKLVAAAMTLDPPNFARKRSVTACQLCRSRKTKCDNKRPICSKCVELSAECTYEDRSSGLQYVRELTQMTTMRN